MAKHIKKFQFGNHEVVLETGEIARQATAAVVVKMLDAVVLVTVVAAKSAREGQDFFPLTVEYQEKFYAGGRIPGGFFKREGRPTERETLTCRLTCVKEGGSASGHLTHGQTISQNVHSNQNTRLNVQLLCT